MPTLETRYLFARSERSIFAEIYFPKRAAYQGTIFNALRFGHDENAVKKYLRINAPALLDEFRIYPALLDPDNYTTKRGKAPPSVERARRRIEKYQSPFQGWSTYSVDGVFFDQEGKMYEEATQVVRVMFRFESSFTAKAVQAGCHDVLRAILFWAIAQQGRLNERPPWSAGEKRYFMRRHEPWPKPKRAFADRHFTEIAKEATKWIDDRALFIFGYLVRQFGEQVLAEHLYEDEIWITSLFDQLLNVIKRVE